MNKEYTEKQTEEEFNLYVNEKYSLTSTIYFDSFDEPTSYDFTFYWYGNITVDERNWKNSEELTIEELKNSIEEIFNSYCAMYGQGITNFDVVVIPKWALYYCLECDDTELTSEEKGYCDKFLEEYKPVTEIGIICDNGELYFDETGLYRDTAFSKYGYKEACNGVEIGVKYIKN